MLDDLESLEFTAPRALLVGRYGLALGLAGRQEEGIATVLRALVQCNETGDHWYAAELRRIHGELLCTEAQSGTPPSEMVARDAEARFVAALEQSLGQRCRSLQLRAATSLGQLWHHAQGRSAEAAQLLHSACTRVTEGLDWDDYQAATRLLQITAQACGQNVTAAAIIRSAAEPASDHVAQALSGKVSERG